MQAEISIKLDLNDKKEREELFKKYTPLMYKIVNQYVGKIPLTFDDICGAAMEGFVQAMNLYKEGTSQSFQQYAAWRMKQAILNSSNEEGHIVKFNAYQQKKAKERGESTYITVSALSIYGGNNDDEAKEDRSGVLGVTPAYEEPVDEEKIMNILYKWLDENFTTRDVEIFTSYFGLNGKQQMKGIDIAKKLGVSTATVTVTQKKIIKALKQQPMLIEELQQLL